ncbi:MAG: hypothetical protein FGF53_00745 [Candidatus Brockarchaeota archaeon]|nr:hypothetical protein [Candidatus Brockarchaeota archaeon]
MVPRRIVEPLLTIISVSFLVAALILPGLRYFFVEPSENLVDKASSYLAPFDYFYLSKHELSGEWSYRVDAFDPGNINLYYDSSYDDSSWSRVEVPFLFKSTRSNSSLWLRKTFTIPDTMRGLRLRLVFSGFWVSAKAWLNGFYLGEHVGYFSQFFFDVDNAVIRDGFNFLTVYLESPVQDAYESRVYPMGIYSFSEVLPDLRNSFIGITGGVTLVGTLNPVINLVLTDVEQYSNPASLSLRVLLQNKGGVDESFSASVRVKSLGSNNTAGLEQSFSVKLSAGERRWETLSISLRDPAYWFPWDIGVPNVYLLNISLYHGDEYAGSVETIFGIRFLEGSISQKNPYVKVNGRSVFLRGGSYFSRLEWLAHPGLSVKVNETLSLLREASVNFLRSFAHVEPKEFYESTSLKGFIVQLDFPLVGAYPTLDYSEYYSRLVKMQPVELLLLTYNYPSITIVCPHVLPPWLNKESPYYGSGANFYLDRDLGVLVKEVNRGIIVLSYAGAYDYVDRFVDYGWGTGSWVDYLHYKEAFPSLISPVGLPSLNSPFWSGVQTLPYERVLQLLEEGGLDPRFLNAYWRDAAENLSSLIELSQKYQSLVLRHAIDRARILKHNVSIGVNILPLTDHPLLVSGSIIDSYGFKKESYYEVRNAFNPVHAVIMVDGDYNHNLTSLYFLPGSTIRIGIWLVNDVSQQPLDAVLSWRLNDLTSNKTLVCENISIEIPSSSSPAYLAVKRVFDAPHHVDSEHILEVSTELFLANGTRIDTNSKRFIVKPSSLIKITLSPRPKEPQLFLVFVNETYMVTRVWDEATIAVPSDSEVTIIGPSLNEKDTYVPQVINLGKLSVRETRNIRINLCPGAIAKVLAVVPSPFDLTIPTQEMRVLLINETRLNQLMLNYDSSQLPILSLLNITGNTLIVPSETDLSILVSITVGGRRTVVEIGNSTQPIRLSKNDKVYLDQPALLQIKSHQSLVNETVESAKRRVEETRNMGLYVGLELYRLEQIERSGLAILNTSDPIKILAHQQEAVMSSVLITEAVQNIVTETRTNQIIVFVMVAILALSIGAILAERKDQYAMFTTVAFIVLMTIAYQVFPGLSRITMLELQVGIYIVIFIFLLVFLAPYFLEIKSERGVSLIPALMIAISYSIGNLKKRKLRTLLTLVSITIMIVAISTLTSIRVSLTTNAIAVAKTWPADKPPVAMVIKPTGPLTPEDFSFIGAQREVLRIDYKVITPVAYDALGYIGEVPIYGVRGISKGDPSLDMIKSATYPEHAIESLFNNSNAVLISRHLAISRDIDVGMTIVFRGVKLKVVGIFDGELVNGIKEPDGSYFLPLYILPGFENGPQPVPADNLLITNAFVAQRLGGYVSALYCTFKDNAQAREVSRRLALLANYSVITMPSSEGITYYFRGGSVEVFGTSVLVPMVITVLNITLLFYTLVYERRNEIFIFSSVGLNPTHISSLFIVEAGVFGFIGGGIGYILSMMTFKVFEVSNIIIPIDVKATPIDMLSLIMMSSLTAMISSTIPALKAAKIATPSLLRRWRIEEKTVREGVWMVRIPVRIPSEKVEMFVNYLYERLPQSSTALELVISDVTREEKLDENGNVSYSVSFKYGKGGNRPFTALTTIEVKKDGEDYAAYVHAKSLYAVLLESNAHEVITHVRKLVLEWSTLRFNVAVVVGESIEYAAMIVRKYRPQFLIVYSRTDVGSRVRELRRRVRSEGIWPPTIEVRRVESRDMSMLVEKLSEEILNIDAICLDSDDGLLSSALAIAAIRLNKNIITFDAEGKMYEISARRFIEKP